MISQQHPRDILVFYKFALAKSTKTCEALLHNGCPVTSKRNLPGGIGDVKQTVNILMATAIQI